MSQTGEPFKFRFTAAGAATTKTTPTGVDGWIEVDVGGTTYFIPFYASKTA